MAAPTTRPSAPRKARWRRCRRWGRSIHINSQLPTPNFQTPDAGNPRHKAQGSRPGNLRTLAPSGRTSRPQPCVRTCSVCVQRLGRAEPGRRHGSVMLAECPTSAPSLPSPSPVCCPCRLSRSSLPRTGGRRLQMESDGPLSDRRGLALGEDAAGRRALQGRRLQGHARPVTRTAAGGDGPPIRPAEDAGSPRRVRRPVGGSGYSGLGHPGAAAGSGSAHCGVFLRLVLCRARTARRWIPPR